MQIPLYQVDAFTRSVFHGNPAAVCPLTQWPSDETLQSIAAENNLSETAFFVKQDGQYHLRWFTPVAEVDLCGHATLASAYVIFNFIDSSLSRVEFITKSGILTVQKAAERLAMNFPARPATPCSAPDELIQGLGQEPIEVLLSRDYLVIYESEAMVRSIQPRMDLLLQLASLGVIISAVGEQVDFVSRFFAPKVGIPEDPVTGSAHSTLIPYWAQKLGKNHLTARQVSRRQGEIDCEYLGDRVRIAGAAVLYCQGHIQL